LTEKGKRQSMIKKLVIIGVGLIGGSLGLALRRNGWAEKIVGVGRSRSSLMRAVEVGAIDSFEESATKACSDADLVVIAASLSAFGPILSSISSVLSDSCIVTDVGSVKTTVIKEAEFLLKKKFGNFVPGHPLAGTEKSGVDSAFATLFTEHKIILTPLQQTNSHAVKLVRAMWCAAGGIVVNMEAQAHDMALAATSHLPHILAYNLVDTVLQHEETGDNILGFSAGSLRDVTRIASSSPEMWADISLANQKNLLDVCLQYEKGLANIMQALKLRDRETLESIFSRAKIARDEHFTDEKK
jgi:prephenate dehydrogenase